MPNKILVIRLSSLGDVILTAPVFKNIKARWPDCSISLLVKPQFAGVLEANPHIDRIIPFKSIKETLALIRAQSYTHLLDLHGNFRSFLIRRFSGVPQIAVYRKNALGRRLYVAFGLRSPGLEKHTVERYLEALSRWDIPVQTPSISLDDYAINGPKAGGGSNILLIQSAFLGDSLLTLPLARRVKELLPDCRLSVLTLESTAEIFRRAPWVDDVLLDHKRGMHGGLAGPWKLAREIRSRSFDLAVIPHRSLRSALVARLSLIPRRIGFDSSAGRFLMTETVPFNWLMHDLERNLALLKPLGSTSKVAPDESVYLSQDPAHKSALAARLQKAGSMSDKSLIGVHPGSAWPTKRWLESRYAELCRRLRQEGYFVVLIGAKQDSELCARVAAQSGAHDWSGRTDLNELKALMGFLSLFITNDSGPMHLATACGVPTLALFGPTTRELGFFPYGPRHRVLEADLSCRPCGLHGAKACPEGHFLCMKLITTDQVFENAKEMLAGVRA